MAKFFTNDISQSVNCFLVKFDFSMQIFQMYRLPHLLNRFIAGCLTLLITLGIYLISFGESIAIAAPTTTITSLSPSGAPAVGDGWEITSRSGSSELALAQHLKKIGAKMYGAFWCTHCYEQKQLFGKEAMTTNINYIECDENGRKSQRELCLQAEIQGFPTWEIKGKKYPGVMAPEKLAELSGYKGTQDFSYSQLLPGFLR